MVSERDLTGVRWGGKGWERPVVTPGGFQISQSLGEGEGWEEQLKRRVGFG